MQSGVLPEVSIIICAYNTEAYIAQAIESALNQVKELLEQRQWTAAIGAILRQPRFLILVSKQLPDFIDRQIQYHIWGNKTVFDVMPQRQRKLAHILKLAKAKSAKTT